ncbi:MAG: sulfurtransferase [Myxococcales bacterium]|nr:sulfurtransferase [Myxococcales bacterium]MCB9708185.1 sulfurtransferase [Myxococcales bacterium]
MEHSPRFLALVEEVKTSISECSVPELVRWMASSKHVHLIDVREESEYAAGHAKDAMHIGRGVLERDIEQLIPDVDACIVLYCGGGYRSALAAENLKRMGYNEVYSLSGGIRAWRAAELPEQ